MHFIKFNFFIKIFNLGVRRTGYSLVCINNTPLCINLVSTGFKKSLWKLTMHYDIMVTHLHFIMDNWKY